MNKKLPNYYIPAEHAEILGRAILHMENTKKETFTASDIATSYPSSLDSINKALNELTQNNFIGKSPNDHSYHIKDDGKDVGEKWLMHQYSSY